jgi:hypothetical protein
MASSLAFAALIDTRKDGRRGTGMTRVCATCGRRHEVWVCFREVALVVPEDPIAPVRQVPTGLRTVVGMACALKLQGMSMVERARLTIILADPGSYVRTPDSSLFPKLISEFS